MPRHSVHDTEPARRWEDAFLSGNGECGIMVSGHPSAERVVFDHHRFVLPNGSRTLAPPQLADRVEEVRDLILAGRPEAAQLLFSDGRPLRWTQPFHPGFVMHIDSDETVTADGYRRTTDFTTGEVIVSWSDAIGSCRRRAFVSRADGVVVQELTASSHDFKVLLSGDLPGRLPDVDYHVTADAVGYRTAVLVIRGTYPPGLGAHGFLGVVKLVAFDGEVTINGGAAEVREATRVLLLTVLSRSETEPDAGASLAVLDALPADYDTLLARHTALHTPMYQRVELDLGVDEAQRALPVADLLATQLRDPAAPHPALVEQMFHAGRYFLISSSGELPPRLTGLWLGAWGAAWSGDFTTDANVNLQLAAATIGAVPEAVTAHTDLIEAQVSDWRDNARAVFGARGVLAPSRTDGESGHLFHFDEEWPWAMWVAGADWLLVPLVEHWQVTGDDRFLADRLVPLLIEAAVFFEDFLTRTDDRGRVVFVPSYSPETGPAGASGVAAVNATMDIAAARHALSAAVDACRHLGIEQDATERWTALLHRFPSYRIDDRGALAEWAWPSHDTPDDHRHISHLYPVWPLHEITPDSTPALAAAAHLALTSRGDENLSAHGSLYRALCAARLKDAELVEANLAKILGNNMVFRSLMTAHNPGLDTYNADAANTLPAVVLESLVYSSPGVIELLPALPGRWSSGTVRGVGCRCGVVVDELTWDLRRHVAHAILRSSAARTVRVFCRRARDETEVVLAAGEPVVLAFTLPT